MSRRRGDAGRHLDLPRTDHTTYPSHRVHQLLRPPGRVFFHRRWRITVHGFDQVPRTGPVVLASNHVGWLDGPLLVGLCPRPVHVLTKREMFTGPVGLGLRLVGQIPVNRYEIDPGAVKTCLRVLRDGGVVGVFPEGTRGAGDLARFAGGAAYLAMVTGAPVVPCVFLGTREPGGGLDSVPPAGSSFDIVFGPPVALPQTPWPRRRREVRGATEQLGAVMRSHLGEALARTGRALPGPVPGPSEQEIENARRPSSPSTRPSEGHQEPS